MNSQVLRPHPSTVYGRASMEHTHALRRTAKCPIAPSRRRFVLLNLASHGSAPGLTLALIRELVAVGRLAGVVVSRQNELLDRIIAAAAPTGVTVLELPLRLGGQSLPKHIMPFLAFLARFARTTAVRDVVIPNHHLYTSIGLPLLRLLGIRVYSGIHDFEPHEGARRWFVRLSNLVICASSHRVLFYSRSQHGLARRRWPWFAHRYEVLRLPTEHQRERSGDEGPRRHDFLFFGRIERYKGMELLLEAFARVRGVRPEVKLHVVGSGRYHCRSLMETDDPQITKSIRYVPDQELADIFLDAKVVVLPYTSATQSGVAHLAAVYGANVVCTPCEGLVEQAEHNPRMRIAADFTPQALADAMLESLDTWTPAIGRSSLTITSGLVDLV